MGYDVGGPVGSAPDPRVGHPQDGHRPVAHQHGQHPRAGERSSGSAGKHPPSQRAQHHPGAQPPRRPPPVNRGPSSGRRDARRRRGCAHRRGRLRAAPSPPGSSWPTAPVPPCPRTSRRSARWCPPRRLPLRTPGPAASTCSDRTHGQRNVEVHGLARQPGPEEPGRRLDHDDASRPRSARHELDSSRPSGTPLGDRWAWHRGRSRPQAPTPDAHCESTVRTRGSPCTAGPRRT
jgi:hypothetical protein